jgi:hypothetical protein
MRAGKLWVVVLLGLAISCKQAPIFFIISKETAPRDPRIDGAPTNMVIFQREYPDRDEPVPIMYVASARLHWYAKALGADEPQWDLGEYATPQPDGKIISLAVTKSANGEHRLYALCRDGNGVNAKLRYLPSRYEPGETWTTIQADSYPDIQSMYADPDSDRLFAGFGRNTYSILYLDNTADTLKMLKADTTLLSGVIFREDIYYLSTRGSRSRGGLFQISETDLANNNIDAIKQLEEAPVNDSNNNYRMFMSMIKLEDNTIIAVERSGGGLYEVQDGSFTRMKYNDDIDIVTGRYATTAIAVWEDRDDPGTKLLIIGIQGALYSTTTSSYTHGYVEFELYPDGSLNNGVRRHDAGNLQSVETRQDQYTTSLGKHPVNHLFQAPKDIDKNNLTFFASTQTAGLWSFRDRPDNGGWQWNAEE